MSNEWKTDKDGSGAKWNLCFQLYMRQREGKAHRSHVERKEERKHGNGSSHDRLFCCLDERVVSPAG